MPAIRGARAPSVADLIGIAGSGLCALHCLIVPVSLAVGSVGPLPWMEDEAFHRVLLWVVVPAAALAFSVGCLRHRDRRVLGMGLTGVLCLTAATTILHDWAGEAGERVLVMGSAGLLITAHGRNYRLCRSAACVHDPAQSAIG